jgi:hypothetical protein
VRFYAEWVVYPVFSIDQTAPDEQKDPAEANRRFLESWQPVSEAQEKDVEESRKVAKDIAPVPKRYFFNARSAISEAQEKDVEESRKVAKETAAASKRCFFNARRAISTLARYAEASYVEGYAVLDNAMSREHGWIVHEGKIIDPTLPDEDVVYFPGLEFQGRSGIKAFRRRPRAKENRKAAFFHAFGWGGKESPSFHKCFEEAMAHMRKLLR